MVVTMAMLVAGLAAAQERVYVVNTADATATVIDPATNAPVGLVVDLPPEAFDVAASPDGRRVYVTNNTEVAVVDTTVNVTVQTVPIPEGAGGIAVNPNGKYAYVISPLSTPFLTVLRTGAFVYSRQVVFLGAIPGDIAISPDGGRLFVTDVFNGTLKVVSTSTYQSFDVGLSPFPSTVAAHPDGARVYVAHPSSNLISVVNFATSSLSTIAVPNPGELAVTPDGSRLYVTDGNGDAVTAIDTATETIVATIPVGDLPFGIAVSADGAFVYVANQLSGDTSVISTATNTVTATIPVGNVPGPVAYVVRRGPGSRYECMDNGWQSFTNPSFQNQGECIAFYNSIH